MVKRKSYILILLSICFIACCYKGPYTSYGSIRQKIRSFSKITENYELIDTTALYKLDAIQEYTHYNLTEKRVSFYEKDDAHYYPYTQYLKFYSNGKLAVFFIPKRDTLFLKREMFNPEKAIMGYYYIKGNDIKIKTAGIINCYLYVFKEKGKIKNDTITLMLDSSIEEIYKKKTIPKELLEGWEPDW